MQNIVTFFGAIALLGNAYIVKVTNNEPKDAFSLFAFDFP